MTSIVGGLIGNSAIVGFGSSSGGIGISSGQIDLTGVLGPAINFAFSAPRAGTITAVTGYFSNQASLSLTATTVTITMQVYASTTPNNIFTAVSGASVTMSPALSGSVAVGSVSTGSVTGLSIPVAAGTRLLFVTSITAAGLSLVNSVTGYASGGVAFN